MKLKLLVIGMALAGPAMAHGDLHERIEDVTRRITRSADPGALYLERAGLHAAHDAWAEAAADYDRAEARQADPVAVALGRGKLLLATGRPAEACTTLDRLLAREPHHVEALVTRARARVTLSDPAGAAADFSAAITASTRPEPEYFLERASALAATTPPQWNAAIRSLEDGLRQLGTGVVTLQLAALDLEIKAGRLDAALARIETASAAAPRPESWLVRRSEVLAMAGRNDEAADAGRAALAAITRLPARLRRTRAMVDLETRARQTLKAVAAETAPRPPVTTTP